MPERLLERVLREIRERLDESRSAYEESRRLEAALDALGFGTADQGHSDGGVSRTRARYLNEVVTSGVTLDDQARHIALLG